MKLPLPQLARSLKASLARVYLVAGDEPLVVDEALEQVRAAAREAGFDSREVHVTDRSFRWAELEGEADNLSLFATRKIIELRMATPRPGDVGSRTIASLAEREDPDTLLLIGVSEKLDSSAQRAAWVKAVERHGVLVEIWPIDRTALPQWIRQRAAAAKLQLTPAAAQLLAERVEGNLLAADQEIKRLALIAAGREVDEAEVLESVANNSRFDVFALADAVLAGDAPRSCRILAGLKAEGVAPVLISWALARDVLLLARLERAVRHGDNIDAVLTSSYVWRRRHPLVKQAIRRFRTAELRDLVAQAARLDAMVKGAADGEPWTAVTDFVLAMVRRPVRTAA